MGHRAARAPLGRIAATGVLTGGARWTTLAMVVVGVTNYGYALLFTRWLDVGAYAVFAAGQGMLLIVNAVSGSSVRWVLASELARSDAEPVDRRGVIWFAVVTNAAQGLLAGVVMGLVAWRLGGPVIAVVVALGAFTAFVATTTLGWLQGETRFAGIAAAQTGRAVATVLVGIGLVAVGLGAAGALTGFVAGAGVVIAIGAVGMRRELRPSRAALALLDLWRKSAGITAIQGLVAVLAGADMVLVALLPMPSADAAGYQVAMTLARVPVFAAGAISMAVFPLFEDRRLPAKDLAASAVRLYTLVTVASVAAFLTVPPEVLAVVFPAGYRSGVARLLPLTAVAGGCIGVVNLLSTFLQAVGSYRRSVARQGLGLLVYAAAVSVGWGVGGVLGVAAGVLLGAAASAWLLRRAVRGLWGRLVTVRPAMVAAGTVLLALFALARSWTPGWVALTVVTGLATAWMAFVRLAGSGAPHEAAHRQGDGEPTVAGRRLPLRTRGGQHSRAHPPAD